MNLTHQRGTALLLLVLLLFVGGSAFFFSAYRGGNAMKTKQNHQVSQALALAKDALIAYAVSNSDQPGRFPCPDTDGDGDENRSGSACTDPDQTGRLPWKTLALPEGSVLERSGKLLEYEITVNYTSGPVNATTSGSVTLTADRDTDDQRSLIFSFDPTGNLLTLTTNGVAEMIKEILDANWAGPPDEYPANQAAFESLMNTDPNVPSWYAANGWNHPTYLRDPLDTSKATLTFADCVAVYTLEQSGGITRNPDHC